MPSTASVIVTIDNTLGLHARPAMLFVQTASKYKSEVQVCRADQDEVVDGKSIMQLMMLAATRGTKLKIDADGDDADQVVKELAALVKSRFQEE